MANFNASMPMGCGGLGLLKAKTVRRYAPLAAWSFYQVSKIAKMNKLDKYLSEELKKPNSTSRTVTSLKQMVEELQEEREVLTEAQVDISDLPAKPHDLWKDLFIIWGRWVI